MLAKEASTPEQFMWDKEVEEIFKKSINSGSVLVGHNRKATKGEVNDENAHPFNRGDIVLVHNGSLFNHKQVANTEVDSEAIADALNEHANGDLADVFGKLTGAYSCVWYDNRDETLNFFRNAARPMYLYRDTNRTLFASEAVMIMYSLIRSNVKWEHEKCKELPVHHHLKYKLQNNGGFAQVGEAQEIKVNFQQGSPATPPKAGHTSTTTNVVAMHAGPTTPTTLVGATDHVSLSRRKQQRKAMQNWLQKHPMKSEVMFTADDYTKINGGEWLIYGTIAGTPPFINASFMLSNRWTEGQVSEFCDSLDAKIPVRLVSYTIDHKKMIYQIDVEIDNEDLYLNSQTECSDDTAFATIAID